MHQYFIKTPFLLKRIFSSYTWSIPTTDKVVYLSFDDGPHPHITPWVLDLLKEHDAKASFFCIGKNVVVYPEIYKRILVEGHAAGNHTHNHLNGWKTDNEVYLNNIKEAAIHIRSNLFRPPYGRIKRNQAIRLKNEFPENKIIMWDVLSADFDSDISEEQCLKNVIDNVSNGSIIVFHDSEKAFRNLKYALPKVMQFFNENNYECRRIEVS